MKFLADEDFPKPITTVIRKLGHSVRTVQQLKVHGASDLTVAKIAIKSKRILLTFDNDFTATGSNRLVIFKFPKIPTSEILDLIPSFLKEIENYSGKIKLQFSEKGIESLKMKN